MRLMYFTTIALSIVMLAILGCSHQGQPTSPSVNRKGAAFADIFNIFEPGTGVLGYHDIDLAPIGNGFQFWLGTSVKMSGMPLEPNGSNHYGCAAVTLMRGPNVDSAFKPVFRWLKGHDDSNLGTMTDIDYVTARDNTDPDNPVTYANPRCDAIYYESNDTNTHFVELAVCYQMRGLTDTQIDSYIGASFNHPFGSQFDEHNDEWDIGVTILRWTYITSANNFPDGEPTREDYFIPDDIFDRQYPNVTPDIAYDHYTGDLYVVYGDGQVPGGADMCFVRYIQFQRLWTPPAAPTTFLLLGFNNQAPAWSPGWPRDVQDSNLHPPAHNGYYPRIDIGLLDLYVNGWIEDQRFVTIVYTAQFQDHTGYNVYCVAWGANDWQNRMPFPILNTDFPGLDAGLPSIDITQNSNDRNFAAVVFTQQVGADGYGPIMRNYEIDSLNMGVYSVAPTSSDAFIPIVTGDYADGLFPSISLMPETGTVGPFHADICYMAQLAEEDQLHPAAGIMEITPNPSPPPVSSSHAWALEPAVWDAFTDNSWIFGNYNMSQLLFIEPGISTAIRSTGDDGNYWAAWCPRIEMEPAPTDVRATFGNPL